MSKETEPAEGTQRMWVVTEGTTKYCAMDGEVGDYWFYGTPMGGTFKVRVHISRCFETEEACLKALLFREAEACASVTSESHRLLQLAAKHSDNVQCIQDILKAREKEKIKAA